MDDFKNWNEKTTTKNNRLSSITRNYTFATLTRHKMVIKRKKGKKKKSCPFYCTTDFVIIYYVLCLIYRCSSTLHLVNSTLNRIFCKVIEKPDTTQEIRIKSFVIILENHLLININFNLNNECSSFLVRKGRLKYKQLIGRSVGVFNSISPYFSR